MLQGAGKRRPAKVATVRGYSGRSPTPVVSLRPFVYVGDRIDNDVAPAKQAGMRTAYVRRGPWGWIHRNKKEVAELSDWQISDLNELAGIVTAENDAS